MNFAKLKSKKILTIIGAFVLVIVCLALAYFLIPNLSAKKPVPQPNKNTKVIVKATPSQVKAVEGTVSPNELLKSPNNYADKDVRVIGVIVEAQGKYRIVDQSGKIQAAILLSTDNNIDFKKYIVYQKTSDGTYISKPVIVNGKFTLDKQAITANKTHVTPTLLVTSVE